MNVDGGGGNREMTGNKMKQNSDTNIFSSLFTELVNPEILQNT